MVNNYQSWSRLENDNKHEHGEHLMSKENPKKNDEHGHYDHLTLSRKKKDDNKHEHNEHLMNDIRKPKNDDKYEQYEYAWTHHVNNTRSKDNDEH